MPRDSYPPFVEGHVDKPANGKWHSSAMALIGALAGSLITTLIFSFSFYGQLKDTQARVAHVDDDMTRLLNLMEAQVQMLSDHLQQPAHIGVGEHIEDHEVRLRALERKKP